jgi:hypothetical protein
MNRLLALKSERTATDHDSGVRSRGLRRPMRKAEPEDRSTNESGVLPRLALRTAKARQCSGNFAFHRKRAGVQPQFQFEMNQSR